MTEDRATETVNLVDDLLDIGVEMAQELQDIVDDMREASGDDSDGAQIASLVERWEVNYVRLMGLVEAAAFTTA